MKPHQHQLAIKIFFFGNDFAHKKDFARSRDNREACGSWVTRSCLLMKGFVEDLKAQSRELLAPKVILHHQASNLLAQIASMTSETKHLFNSQSQLDSVNSPSSIQCLMALPPKKEWKWNSIKQSTLTMYAQFESKLTGQLKSRRSA